MFANVLSKKTSFQILAMTLCVFALVGIVMLGSTSIAFCEGADETIQTAVSGITEQIYKIMRAIIIPCCIVALAFAAFQFIAGGSQGAEKARKAVIGVIASVAFVTFAPMVMNTIGGFLADSGSGDWDSYNPLD